jgi:hypothetical protein
VLGVYRRLQGVVAVAVAVPHAVAFIDQHVVRRTSLPRTSGAIAA